MTQMMHIGDRPQSVMQVVYNVLRRVRCSNIPELAALTGLRVQRVEDAIKRLRKRGFVKAAVGGGWYRVVNRLRDVPDFDYAEAGRRGNAARQANRRKEAVA